MAGLVTNSGVRTSAHRLPDHQRAWNVPCGRPMGPRARAPVHHGDLQVDVMLGVAATVGSGSYGTARPFDGYGCSMGARAGEIRAAPQHIGPDPCATRASRAGPV